MLYEGLIGTNIYTIYTLIIYTLSRGRIPLKAVNPSILSRICLIESFGHILTYLQGEYDLAIHFLDRAIAGKKDSASLFINRGDALLRLHEFPLALADYRQALEICPRDGGSVKSRIAFIHNQYGLALYHKVTIV